MSEFRNNDFKKIIQQAHKLLFLDHNMHLGVEFLEEIVHANNITDFGVLSWLALAYLEELQLDDAKKLYLSLNQYYQAGFCELLKGNIAVAQQLWLLCKKSEVKYWGECLSFMVLGKIDKVPSFLGLRNHLEADLGYFLRAQQLVFVENIASIIDQLSQINLECYKFLGRALLNNGFENLSVQFLLKAVDILPNDPEAFYHIGQYSMKVGAIDEARSMFKHCILISPSYSPAYDRLKELENTTI